MPTWNAMAANRDARLKRAAEFASGKVVDAQNIRCLLGAVLERGDRVCLEGNNQKQADFLAKALTTLDPERVNGLHMVQSVLALSEHLDVFDRGIASRLDFSFSGPQAGRLANLLAADKLSIGAIHTYLELFGRYFTDLTPRVALVCAQSADSNGNLYTGDNTEDTPVIVEATAFRSGIVIAQVNEIVETLPRVDIPGDWVNFIVASPKPHYIEPLFTRDPAQISEIQVSFILPLPARRSRWTHGVNQHRCRPLSPVLAQQRAKPKNILPLRNTPEALRGIWRSPNRRNAHG